MFYDESEYKMLLWEGFLLCYAKRIIICYFSLADGDVHLSQRPVPQENGEVGGSSASSDMVSRSLKLTLSLMSHCAWSHADATQVTCFSTEVDFVFVIKHTHRESCID